MTHWLDRLARASASNERLSRRQLAQPSAPVDSGGESRLDAVARTLAAPMSRRQMLGASGATLAAVALGGLRPRHATASHCAPGATLCGNPENDLCCRPERCCAPPGAFARCCDDIGLGLTCCRHRGDSGEFFASCCPGDWHCCDTPTGGCCERTDTCCASKVQRFSGEIVDTTVCCPTENTECNPDYDPTRPRGDGPPGDPYQNSQCRCRSGGVFCGIAGGGVGGPDSVALCCPPGEICDISQTCCGFQGRCRCPGTRCGDACCAAGEQCVETSPGTFRCSRCRLDETECGSACCPPGEVCSHEPSGAVCRAECPRGQLRCGDFCCAESETCVVEGGEVVCRPCPEGQLCGSRCCEPDRVCVDPEFGTCCPPGESKLCAFDDGDFRVSTCCAQDDVCCGQFCCAPGTVCVRPETGMCCPPEQVCQGTHVQFCCPEGATCCGDACCPSGAACLDPGSSTCCPEDRPKICRSGDNAQCCPEGTSCCGTACCAGGAECLDAESSTCCPESRPKRCASVGSAVCCAPGDQCVGTGLKTCCPPARVCVNGAVCCPPGTTCKPGPLPGVRLCAR